MPSQKMLVICNNDTSPYYALNHKKHSDQMKAVATLTFDLRGSLIRIASVWRAIAYELQLHLFILEALTRTLGCSKLLFHSTHRSYWVLYRYMDRWYDHYVSLVSFLKSHGCTLCVWVMNMLAVRAHVLISISCLAVLSSVFII